MVRLLLQFRLLGFDFSACSINRDSPWDSLRDKAFPRWFAFCCSVVFLVSTLLVARCGASFWLPCQIGPNVARVGSKLVPNWPQDGQCWLMLATSWPQVGPCWLIRRTPGCPWRPRETPENPNRFSGASAGVPKASQGVPKGLPRRLPRFHSPQNEAFSRWFAFRCLVHLPGFSLGYSPG